MFWPMLYKPEMSAGDEIQHAGVVDARNAVAQVGKAGQLCPVVLEAGDAQRAHARRAAVPHARNVLAEVLEARYASGARVEEPGRGVGGRIAETGSRRHPQEDDLAAFHRADDADRHGDRGSADGEHDRGGVQVRGRKGDGAQVEQPTQIGGVGEDRSRFRHRDLHGGEGHHHVHRNDHRLIDVHSRCGRSGRCRSSPGCRAIRRSRC